MKQSILISCLILSGFSFSFAQGKPDPLFETNKPLDIAFRISIKEFKKTKTDSSYQDHRLYYRSDPGSYDSLLVKMKCRGNFRYRTCYYPPIWIKIRKKQAKGTPFEGNKSLKLILPCRNQKGNIEIIRELICYKLFEQISPYAFHTRLANIEFIEKRKNKEKKTGLNGILLEDIDKTAARYKARPMDNVRLHPHVLEDTNAIRLYLFEYMISNTDWSTIYQHNTKLIFRDPDVYVSIPYDFDMSGMVDAPYSVVSQIGDDKLDINHVTERLYRGFCDDSAVTEFVRREFISKEASLLKIPDDYEAQLPRDEVEEIKAYLKQFFEIISRDDLFKYKITSKCRLE